MIMRKIKYKVVASILSLCILMTQSTIVFADPASDSGASESANIGTSMYDVSTALTAYANSVVGSNTNDKHNSHTLVELKKSSLGAIKPGVAGSIVGYGDEKKDFYAYISSNTAKSVTTSSYDAWLNAGDDGATYAYTRYGHLLYDLGLDDTAPNTETSGFRKIFGYGMYGIHAISGFVPKIFDFSMSILKTLNPFQFFIGDNYSLDIKEDSTTATDADGQTFESNNENVSTYNSAKDAYGNMVEQPAILKPLRDFITPIYSACQSIGLFVIIPLLLAILLATLLLKSGSDKTNNKWSKVRVFLTRFAFIVVGIPLCGVMYTSLLNDITSVVQDKPASSRMVACTFVDFQTWVQSSRLALPSDVTLTSSGTASDEGDSVTAAGSADANTVRQLRNYVFKINQKSGLLPSTGFTSGLGISNQNDMLNPGMWDTNGALASDGNTDSVQKKMAALLSRYGDGSFYQASAWETAVNGVLTDKHASELGSTPSTANADSNVGTVYEMYDEMDEVSDWLNREVQDNKAIFSSTPVGTKFKWTNFNIVANGDLKVTSPISASEDLTYSGGTWTSENAADPKIKGGLSSVAMYNYLSTAFGDSSISVYSAVNSTSEYTKQSHFSVNLVGSGVLRGLYAANCIAAMGIFAIIGVVYGLGMITGNLKRGISLIMQVPGAMMGALKSITQIIVYVFVMCVELIATVFVYQFICDLIVMFSSIIETPIQNAVSSASVVIGGNFAMIGNVVSADMIRNNVVVFEFGFLMIILGLLFIGKNSVTRRRAILTAYEYVACKYVRCVTFKEFKPVFDAWMAQRKSLYAWDIISDVIDDMSSVVDNVHVSTLETKGV